eukprot:361255-Chlamydomonas_euryale.AAC.6
MAVRVLWAGGEGGGGRRRLRFGWCGRRGRHGPRPAGDNPVAKPTCMLWEIQAKEKRDCKYDTTTQGYPIHECV